MKVAGVVLAAGGSRRLGQPKQLLLVDGEPLVARAANAARSACDAVAVVVGARAAEVHGAVRTAGVVTVHNAEWREGVASSIRAGVAWARTCKFDSVLLLTVDQHRLTAAHARALVDVHRRGHALVGSSYAGVTGVPAVFSREHFGALLALRGDSGARDLLRGRCHAVIPWEAGELDVDTPEALARC